MTAKKKEPVEVPIPIAIAPRVRSIQITDKAWYAATNEGLFISVDGGKKWYGTPVEGESDFVAANDYPDGTMTLASIKRAFVSRDEGRNWSEVTIPNYVTGIYNFTMTPDSSIWLGTREGAIRSSDGGKTWAHIMSGLPPSYVLGVKYDANAQRLLATAINSRGVFESVDGGKTWKQTPEASFSIRTAMGYQDLLLAISWHNGLLMQRERRARFRPVEFGASAWCQNAEQQSNVLNDAPEPGGGRLPDFFWLAESDGVTAVKDVRHELRAASIPNVESDRQLESQFGTRSKSHFIRWLQASLIDRCPNLELRLKWLQRRRMSRSHA